MNCGERSMPRTGSVWPLPLVLLLALGTAPAIGQHGTTNGQWRAYAGDPSSTKYSPLDQINKDNAKNLRVAWRFKTDNLGVRPDYNMQATPVMVNGVLYTAPGTRLYTCRPGTTIDQSQTNQKNSLVRRRS